MIPNKLLFTTFYRRVVYKHPFLVTIRTIKDRKKQQHSNSVASSMCCAGVVANTVSARQHCFHLRTYKEQEFQVNLHMHILEQTVTCDFTSDIRMNIMGQCY